MTKKTYYVIPTVNGDYCDGKEFGSFDEAKAFFDKKAKGLAMEMIKENDQAVCKFSPSDSYGYELWCDDDDEIIDSASRRWSEING